MIFNKVSIGDVVTLRQGFAINKNTKHHMSDEPTDLHLLRIGDMKDGSYSVYVKDTIPAHFIANEDDIIYTRTGQVGLVFRKQHGVIHNNCFSVTPQNEDVLDRGFLFYVLQTKEFYEEANSKASGAAQPDLPHGAFNSISIPIPNLDTQKKVSNILQAYDDLIENNQKQIKLLEEAAQRLYKEWFVDLRFPGHEEVDIVDGVPEGWSLVSVSDCLTLHMNGGWGKESPTGKNTHPGRVIRGTDINDIKDGKFESIPLRYHSDNDVSKRTLQRGDIVFELSNGNINNIGRSLLIDELILSNCGKNTICASFCKMFRPIDRLHGLCLYREIQEMQSDGRMLLYKKQGANGINNFAFEDFLEHRFLIPNTDALLEPFESIMNEMSSIQRRFSLLMEARDRLLPKLMSGEIEL